MFLPGESHGQRSLVGYSPWGRKESDMTEWLTTHTHTHTHPVIQKSYTWVSIQEKWQSKQSWSCSEVLYSAPLVARWWRIQVPIQETQIRILIQEAPPGHNRWAWAGEPGSCNHGAQVPWSVCSVTRGAATTRNRSLQLGKGSCSNRDPAQPKTHTQNY